MLPFIQPALFPEDGAALTPAAPAALTNKQIADVLFNIATILEMQQGNPYRITAYRNAARGLIAFKKPLAEIFREKGELAVSGFGKRLHRKVSELVSTGRMTFYNDLCEAALPEDVRSLMAVPEIGPRLALRLANSLGIHSVAALYEAAHTHKLREQYGFGPRSEQRLEAGARAVLTAGQAA
jgi:DNA polymerase (family 10)